MSFVKNSIYKIADILTLNKGLPNRINNYRILFPAKWARYFEKDYEKENIEFLTNTCIPGMTVIDIGAHLGLMSVIISKLIGDKGKIYSFEPTPKTFAIFKDIIKKNNGDKIIFPFNKAVSNFDGKMDFFVDENEGSNANSLVGRKDKSRISEKMDVTTLDTFVKEMKLDKLDLIKIDAEGSELDVLHGALETFEKFKPKIVLAIHPSLIKNNNQNIGDIFDVIHSLEYDVHYRSEILTKEIFIGKQDFFDVHLISAKK